MKSGQVVNVLNKLIAVEITSHFSNGKSTKETALITPYKVEENRLYYYWEDGSSFSLSYLQDLKVLHNYGCIDIDTDWNKIYLHFIRNYEFIQPSEIKSDNHGSWRSWIAPNGDFYLTYYGDHDETAKRIVACLENKYMLGYEAREYLLKEWVQLFQGKDECFLVGRNKDWDDWTITKSQYETVKLIESISSLDFDIEHRRII